MIVELIFASAAIALVRGNCSPCPEIPKHYEELGCKGVHERGDCCPERFECPDYLSYNKNQCQFKGRAYEIGEDLLENNGPSCSAACKCVGFSDTKASFTCADIECPEFFGVPHGNCVLQYSLDSCCSIGKVCDAKEIEALPTCTLRGQTYQKGQMIYPEYAPCYKCICDEKFDNSTDIKMNKNCKKIDCGIELRSLNSIQEGCIPIYYGENGCCPIEYRCPAKTDAILEPEARANIVAPPEMTCKYGDLILKRGESLNSEDKCLECMCKFPPMVQCTKKSGC